jgi:hypothetical protein
MQSQFVPVENNPFDTAAMVVVPLDRVRRDGAIAVVDEVLTLVSIVLAMVGLMSQQFPVIVSKSLGQVSIGGVDLFPARGFGIGGRS